MCFAFKKKNKKKLGFIANRSITINETDFEGPVPTIPVERFDYYLFVSWLFVIFVSIDFIIRKSAFWTHLSRTVRFAIVFATRFRERFFMNGGPNNQNLAIDQQQMRSALVQTASSSSSQSDVGSNASTSGASFSRAGGYNYRPRRTLHHPHND